MRFMALFDIEGMQRYNFCLSIQTLHLPLPMMTPPIQTEALYTVGLDPERPRHLRVEVQWSVDGDQTLFRLPQWRPGRYEQSLLPGIWSD